MSDTRDIAAIVLAAGSSRRFGSNKLLHPVTLRGVTLPLAAHSLLPWILTCRQVTVVVGPRSDDFCHAIESVLGRGRSTALCWSACADAEQGMAASLRCGVRANPNAIGWLIGLADMPMVPVRAITAVRDALFAGAPVASPSRNGRRGHPVGFSCSYRADLLGLAGDVGARQILDRDRLMSVDIEINDAGILADVDTVDDLADIDVEDKSQIRNSR